MAVKCDFSSHSRTAVQVVVRDILLALATHDIAMKQAQETGKGYGAP